MEIRLVLDGATGDLAPVALSIFLEALTRWNTILIARRNLPSLYQIPHVRYEREDYNSVYPEDWRDATAVVKHRGGDCEDLATYRAADLQLAGIAAKPMYIENKTPAGRMFHIIVERPNGELEDPSRLLGMKRV